MWRERTFYIGCSIGIWSACILGAILFFTQYQGDTGNQSASPDKNPAYTTQQIQQLAASRHLVVLTQDAYAAQKKQLTQLQGQLKQLQQTIAASSSRSNVGKNQVYVAIQPGLTVSETGELLNKAGVIDDVSSFVQATNQLHSFIKAGVYAFPMHTDNQTVLTIITK
ncbi:endolytic transglycosylase MltG [Fodinisporobacter ferrooxydans]|uniref:Endolytic transglycosylase MltG n=1 Tax=Fodinisporobacter ferrooxydans TaxID=2901836 RepID=A0ABY4CFT2_9BACL|nr:endolytic transglycosylase MltG [Alicyclobacillaceae bacterium MYW30-H2]